MSAADDSANHVSEKMFEEPKVSEQGNVEEHVAVDQKISIINHDKSFVPNGCGDVVTDPAKDVETEILRMENNQEDQSVTIPPSELNNYCNNTKAANILNDNSVIIHHTNSIVSYTPLNETEETRQNKVTKFSDVEEKSIQLTDVEYKQASVSITEEESLEQDGIEDILCKSPIWKRIKSANWNQWYLAKWIFTITAGILMLVSLYGMIHFFSKGKKIYSPAEDPKEAFMKTYNMTEEDYEIEVHDNRTLARKKYPWIPYLWLPDFRSMG